MRKIAKTFDIDGSVRAFLEALDLPGFVAGVRSSFDLPAVREGFAAGFNRGAAQLAGLARWTKRWSSRTAAWQPPADDRAGFSSDLAVQWRGPWIEALTGWARRGHRLHIPPPEAELPPGIDPAAAEIRAWRLSIDLDRVVLSAGAVEVAGPPPDPDRDFGDLGRDLRRARAGWHPPRPGTLELALQEAGSALAEAFLPSEVAAALAGIVSAAARLNRSVQLALAVADPLADLPWETLRLPQTGPLALHPRVEFYRVVDAAGGRAPDAAIPGPLRILVAIGSPEAQNARGELLDYEAESQRILDATDTPQRQEKAFVHILEQGTVAAIHDALAVRRYHILHISCHAAPDALILEDAEGGRDLVSAERLWQEALPADRAPPLVVLAGCSTASGTEAGDAERLPGLARTLVRRGVPAVVAMQAPVGDRYATELIGTVYQALANREEPQPLAALSFARRRLEHQRTDVSPPQLPPEWATPSLFIAGRALPLYDPKAPAEALAEAPAPSFDPGVVVRRIGDMVGRRRDQRLILRALRDPDMAGVLIHGMGGVGKTTLAAQILHRLARADDFLAISVKGETDPDRMLFAIADRLQAIAPTDDEGHPLRRLAGRLRDPRHPWRARFEALRQSALGSLRIVFFFDNFEDNLVERALPEELAALLSLWLRVPGRSRLVFTCRYPFALPDEAEAYLYDHHLGPLSWAETRKLLWRLEGLKALSAEEQRRAYEEVGGHPRALEYLDAILRGGKARFTDVQLRLRRQLAADGIDPARWCADTAGNFDAALAETVTRAARDVLLDGLVAQVQEVPLAWRLLIGAATYRVPLDDLGLAWAVGEPHEQDADPARTARLQDAVQRVNEARKENPAADASDVARSQEELRQWLRDMEEERRPPVETSAGFAAAKQLLDDLSFLAPVRFADDEEDRYFVHRWTAAALALRASEAEQEDAHRAAAAYWRWRVAKRPQSRQADVQDLLEARHHLRAIGDLAEFHLVSGTVISQLDVWGAWEWEERLIRETLAALPEGSREAAAHLHQLGIVAQHRGDYDDALEWYREALAIKEQFADRAGMAVSYHNLGVVSEDRGDYEGALDWYRKSLAIFEEIGDRTHMAASYHQLGRVAQERDDYDSAIDWYHKSLAIFEQLGDRDGMGDAFFQLGSVLDDRGDYKEAFDWYSKSLPIFEQLGNREKIAAAYHNLGVLAERSSSYEEALGRYRESLSIKEQLGDRAGMAASYSQIGVLYTKTGRAAEAVPLSLQGLILYIEMRLPAATVSLYWLSRQREILGATQFEALVAKQSDAESVPVLKMIDDFEAAQQGAGDAREAE